MLKTMFDIMQKKTLYKNISYIWDGVKIQRRTKIADDSKEREVLDPWPVIRVYDQSRESSRDAVVVTPPAMVSLMHAVASDGAARPGQRRPSRPDGIMQMAALTVGSGAAAAGSGPL